ncbi:MAG: type 2 isopentenyl-diphosphate Delta-isomerase [Anaerolineales bacterium]|jgi:isopentenyl-diphosphate delta-isomerase
MGKVTNIKSRKSDHIRINLENDVRSSLTTGLERYQFIHRALPEIDLGEVDTSLSFFNKELSAPVLISSMTGGTSEAADINRKLAIAAQEARIAMGVGSQRVAIENHNQVKTFSIRKYAPDILLFANLGAVQLNYGYGPDECKRAVEMIDADALVLHLNALQEALQPEGDTNFRNLYTKIEEICKKLAKPVVVKEVGWGFSSQDAKLLMNAGVSAIDVAGAGGTSWSQVEMYRAEDDRQAQIASSFVNWGIPTSNAIRNVRNVSVDMPLIASGGIRNGVDIAKCIALGANLCGLASPLLKAAQVSAENTFDTIEIIMAEIRISMFSSGVKNLSGLDESVLFHIE